MHEPGATLLLSALPKTPLIGTLPGDIVIKRENFTFSLPLATSIIINILISLLFYLFQKFRP